MRLCGRAQSRDHSKAGREGVSHLLPAPRSGNRSTRLSSTGLPSQHRLPYTYMHILQVCSYMHRLTPAVFVFPESVDSAEGRKVLCMQPVEINYRCVSRVGSCETQTRLRSAAGRFTDGARSPSLSSNGCHAAGWVLPPRPSRLHCSALGI